MRFLEIRNDDVLQVNPVSAKQRSAIKKKDWFQRFLEADKIFEKYNYPCTLAILSEGIDVYPEWVEHIKKNLHRYKIELHGSSHYEYNTMSEEEGEKDLREAIDKIEKTFGKKITTWYVTYGRRFIPEWGERVCKRLGIKCDVPRFKMLPFTWKRSDPIRTQINFHYWDFHQVKQIEKIVETICQQEFIKERKNTIKE